MRIFTIFTLLTAALAAPTHDAIDAQFEAASVDSLSMPDLVNVKDVAVLGKDWQLRDSAQLYEGRIVLTPKPVITSKTEHETTFGSILSNKFDGTSKLKEFETQVTLRSLGSRGATGAGWSLFLLGDDDKAVNQYNMNHFGGPSKFTGLQVVLDGSNADLGPVFRVFLNDGSGDVRLKDGFIGAWRYEYQASNVPVTLKIGYSENWLKISADNKLLFETDKVNLASVINSKNFRILMAAASPKDLKRYEQFEVLRVKSYAMVSAELKAECKQSLVPKHFPASEAELMPPEKLKAPAKGSAGLPDKLTGSGSKSESTIGSAAAGNVEMKVLLNELSSIKNMINEKCVVVSDGKGGTNMEASFQKQVGDIQRAMQKLTDNVNNVLRRSEESNKKSEILERKYDHLQDLLQRQQELLENAEVSSKSLGRSFQKEIARMGQSIDTKVDSIHEAYKKQSINGNSNPELEARLNGLNSFVKMVLFPLLAICSVIAFLVYRLRRDIQHSKVL